MEKALKFTEEYIDIPTDDRVLIKYAQKSLLFNKSKSSMKKASWIFDVAIDALEGAEICKLVGNFLLHKLSEKYERKDLALYRDDRLKFFNNISGPVSEKIKKYFYKLSREHDLELTIQCNRKVGNFQYVTWNLENSSYCPYLKDKNKIIYEHRIQSPSPIIKQLPKSLRLSQLSANEKILKNWIKPYKEALTKAGYKHKMWYQQNIRQNATTTNHRKRNIIWFNPPLQCQCCDNSWETLPVFIK